MSSKRIEELLSPNQIDEILDEIEDRKEELTLGDNCEIYSRSKDKWFKGEIVNVFDDEQGHWFSVKYDENKQKEIQPLSNDIRVIIDKNKNENKQNKDEKKQIDDNNFNWDIILKELKSKNINYIKNLITSKTIHINEQNSFDGRTLLIYAIIIGSLELVTVICNFGADVKIKDNNEFDALDYAMKYGRIEITQLIFCRTLSGLLGKDLKHIMNEQKRQTEEAQYILNANIGHYSATLQNCIVELMIKAMKEMAPFDEAMLFYAWYFVVKNAEEKNKSPFELKSGSYEDEPGLWETMMKTYENILSDTSNKKGWKWLKSRFLSSYIWYLPHPNCNNKKEEKKESEMSETETDNECNKMETILQNTLFYELLKRVRKESKKQSDILLKEKIDKIKRERPSEWNALISYNVNSKYCKLARQDKVGCLIPKYKEKQLSEDIYPPTNHFNAKNFYDTSIYLSNLLFRANILDDMFQKQMKQITKDINKQNGYDIIYRAGPVKTLKRSQAKIENDYINEEWPTAAKILDINRCALQFKNINSMMQYLQIFADKIKNKNAGIIKEIIRCKNGWAVYNEKYPKYTDIKLNALIQTPKNGSVICEIQFLLNIMSSFKRKAHKLYAVERKLELVYNFGLLNQRTSKFKDNKNLYEGVLN